MPFKRKFFRNPLSKARAQRRAVFTDITDGGKDVDRADVVAAIRAIFGEDAGRIYFTPRDRDYQTVDEDVLHAFLRGDGTDAYAYQAEGFDCDDSAEVLAGRVREATALASGRRAVALGRIYALNFVLEADGEDPVKTGHHAMNVAMLNDGRIVLVEPQNDRVYPLTAASTVYFVDI